MTTRPPQVHNFAAVVDVENITHDHCGHLAVTEAQNMLDQVGTTLTGIRVTVALKRGLAARYAPALVGRGWRVLIVDHSPDAADRALVEAGLAYAAAGCTDLVAVSGDRAFAVLASVARLHVVSLRDRVSQDLVLAASTVSFVKPAGRTRPRAA